MIYVVSGYRRSGTSAMMAALTAGGLPALSNVKIDEFNARQPVIDGYRPTKLGLYEVGRMFYMDPRCMRRFVSEHDETAVKVFYDGLPILPAHEYVVIFMQRSCAEIVESLAIFDAYQRQRFKRAKVLDQREPAKTTSRYPFDVYSDYRPDDVQQCLEIAKARKDIEVIEVPFSDLIESPNETLQAVRQTPLGRVRVPIDIDKAAAVIDPDWYRCVA